MKRRQPTNFPHSIHQRLLNRAKEEGRPFQELLQYYAIERFLFRLGRSPYADKFLLKGALMLRVWDSPLARPTLDVDLLGRMTASEEAVAGMIKTCFVQEAGDDGIRFDPDSMRTEAIRAATGYPGIRVRFIAYLAKIRVPMQIDVGFGDAVVPGPVQISLPTLLDLPSPQLLAYPPESAVAEKLQTMVELDMANSRMKDFHDVWTLGRNLGFEGMSLSKAIKATFERRHTPVPFEVPTALTAAFVENSTKQTQWRAFLRKGRLEAEGKSLEEVIIFLRRFLMPPTLAIADGKRFTMRWLAGGPWRAGRAKRR